MLKSNKIRVVTLIGNMKKTWINLEFDNLGKQNLKNPEIWDILKKT